MRYLWLLGAGLLLCPVARAADAVSEADARLALKIASGLSGAGEGPGASVTIRDAVLLLRGARGAVPAGVSGSALLQLRDEVRLEGDAVRNYTLARAYRFTGRLVDAAGNPASGAVWLEDDKGAQKGFSQFGREGQFAMGVGAEPLHTRVSADYPMANGQGSLHVTAPMPAQDVALTGDTRRDIVRPEKPPTGFVEGTIRTGGLAVHDIDVDASVRLGSDGYAGSFGLAKEARYTVECAAGMATLKYQAWTGMEWHTTLEFQLPEPVEVRAGETVTRDVAFPTLATVNARVLGGPDWPERPVMQVSLDNQQWQGAWFRSCVREPKAEGFTLPALPGKYQADVLFERRDGALYRQYGYRMDVTVPEGGGKVDLACPPETPERALSGRVTDADGRPVAGAEVHASLWRRADDGFAFVQTKTDGDGRYALRAPAGSYSLYVEPPKG